jgi:hypothetical protein
MDIKTEYDPKPIPYRDFDWTAYDAETYDGAEDSRSNVIGFGATKEEAVNDLMEKIGELATPFPTAGGHVALLG